MDFEDSGLKPNGSEEAEVYEIDVIDEDDSIEGLDEATPQEEAAAGDDESPEEGKAAGITEVEVLRDEVAHLREMYLRKLAEFDNFRKRIEREREELKRTAAEEIVLDLIPVLDNFERALDQDVDSDSEAFRQGVEMISRQLQGVLGKSGLEQFDSMGKPFQPELHEAVQQVENSDLPPGTVAWVLAKGYLYGGRLVRPAMVGVTREGEGNDQGVDAETEAKEESGP